MYIHKLHTNLAAADPQFPYVLWNEISDFVFRPGTRTLDEVESWLRREYPGCDAWVQSQDGRWFQLDTGQPELSPHQLLDEIEELSSRKRKLRAAIRYGDHPAPGVTPYTTQEMRAELAEVEEKLREALADPRADEILAARPWLDETSNPREDTCAGCQRKDEWIWHHRVSGLDRCIFCCRKMNVPEEW